MVGFPVGTGAQEGLPSFLPVPPGQQLLTAKGTRLICEVCTASGFLAREQLCVERASSAVRLSLPPSGQAGRKHHHLGEKSVLSSGLLCLTFSPGTKLKAGNLDFKQAI